MKTARVRLRELEDQIELTVSDRGAGFDPELAMAQRATAGGFGISSIRERLDLLGGRLEIHSRHGEGSRFTLLAPRKAVEAAAG